MASDNTISPSLAMFVARLENMHENNDRWLTVQAVLALLNDCLRASAVVPDAPTATEIRAAPSEPLLRDFKGSTEDALRMALQMLHDDQANYIERNNLHALDNHAMRLAREALAFRPSAVLEAAPLTDEQIDAVAYKHDLANCRVTAWRDFAYDIAALRASTPSPSQPKETP